MLVYQRVSKKPWGSVNMLHTILAFLNSIQWGSLLQKTSACICLSIKFEPQLAYITKPIQLDHYMDYTKIHNIHKLVFAWIRVRLV